jgi:hypothetical protein
MNNKETLKIANYCVSFIDLLGQRTEYKNEGLLLQYESTEEKEKFKIKVQNTIGKIDFLQRAADIFLNGVLNYKSPEREMLAPDRKVIYDKVKEVHLNRQRWSDGLVYFISLEEGKVQCPIQGVYIQLITNCYLCFFGLANGIPLRGSMDIAWAAELHEGELYGAAVAKAYELETCVAQYPRIVIGQRVIDYIIFNMNKPASNDYDEVDKTFAKKCFDMLAQDFDGHYVAHYLGGVFHEMVTKSLHGELYQSSIEFVLEQCKKWRDERNTKLSSRYNHLLSYFLSHSPSESQEENAKSGVE